MLIKDLELIEKLSKRNEDKNWRFRSYLKMQEGKEIDLLVKPIYEFVKKNIDCLECGNCCRKLRPIILKGNPCIFLNGNKCEIYKSRPNDCKSFPHLQKRGFTTRLIGIIEYSMICPIVFNVFEELKIAMKFR
ncbi:MAG: YkgJ family cysteine cluster protein [Bacteroidales bacterium]|nr:YkgJ family cysteine cluster protein [Bacteroidales bacterium]